jgi:hypothetical protein
MRFISLIVIVLYVITSCKTERPVNTIPANAELHFGSSGGFANAKEEFILGLDGNLWHRKNAETKKLVINVGEKKAKELIKQAMDLQLDILNSKHPGNMTYFLQYKEGQVVNEVSWGDKAYPPAKDIKELYDKLYGLRP